MVGAIVGLLNKTIMVKHRRKENREYVWDEPVTYENCHIKMAVNGGSDKREADAYSVVIVVKGVHPIKDGDMVIIEGKDREISKVEVVDYSLTGLNNTTIFIS